MDYSITWLKVYTIFSELPQYNTIITELEELQSVINWEIHNLCEFPTKIPGVLINIEFSKHFWTYFNFGKNVTYGSSWLNTSSSTDVCLPGTLYTGQTAKYVIPDLFHELITRKWQSVWPQLLVPCTYIRFFYTR